MRSKIRFGKTDDLGEIGQKAFEGTRHVLNLLVGCTDRECLEVIAVLTQALASAKTGYLIATQLEGEDDDLVYEVLGRFVEAEALAMELTYTDACRETEVENILYEKHTLQ